jgi:hypothetical protein
MSGDQLSPIATLIGDIVASKGHGNRRRLQRTLNEALAVTNARLEPLQALELTVGDEFQGGFRTVGGAAAASLVVRLELLRRDSSIDSRYGLGYGPISVFDAARLPTSQDGPGWWSARSAIERAAALAESPRTWFVRTCFAAWSQGANNSSPVEAAGVDAFLLCRDAIVDRMDLRARRLLLGLLTGRSQTELASDEGITQSAVSQRLRTSGAYAIEIAQREFDETPA